MRTSPGQHGLDQERKAQNEKVPEGDLIYRSVRQDGEFALEQSSLELAASGFAAGLSMGFSLIAEGLLRAHLPDTGWAPLVSKFGYSVGFLIVILGRQQLFTEQTLSAMLPLLAGNRRIGTPSNLARLWSVVLLANIAGIAVTAASVALTSAFPHHVHEAFTAIGHSALSHGFPTTLMRAIYAGFLIAVMVWLLPGAGAARLWIVVLITYVIALGAFSHIVAGSAECLYLVFSGQRGIGEYVVRYFVPTLAGNTIGGVLFVAALAHAQHAPESP